MTIGCAARDIYPMSHEKMPEFVDQLNRIVQLDHFPPKRIVSLVPSITELLFDLGLDHEIIGVTRFCIYPTDKSKVKPHVGGTKSIDIEKVIRLKPDLIIANKEENTLKDVELLSSACPVWVSDVTDFESAVELVVRVGEITGTSLPADALVRKINTSFYDLRQAPTLTAAYLIWQQPIMVAGGGTYINDMLSRAGFQNVFSESTRYPTVNISAIKELNPDVVLLSSEPYPFKESHLSSFTQIHGFKKVILVDGTFFSWYGSRMQHAPNYFTSIRAANFGIAKS